ncbi:MAG: PilZ domain-containing protein [Sedimentisphaerales bacterium]|nr:PilZ domain-containing protein [Sedimentisphaerales bacterium]
MQTMQTVTENRREVRTNLAWPVSVWIPETNRFFNGKSCNISKGGALVQLPMTAPVRVGHVVELNFPRTQTLAKQKGQFARIKIAKVVRIDRSHLMENAHIGIAVQFT